MMGLTFDPIKHEYHVDGVRYPSVTEIIDQSFPWIPPPGATTDDVQYWRDRGTATHHACRLSDEGRLDESTVADAIKGRVDAWRKFRADFPAEVVEAETPRYHALYRYAGTRDCVMEDDNWRTIVDIKSAIEPTVIPQLGGYYLFDSNATQAVAVELHDDGTYKALWLNKAELRAAGQTFLAMLSVWNFAAKHNLLRVRK